MAVGAQSSKVALGAMRNRDRDRPLDSFGSERVGLGREVEQLPSHTFEGGETVFNTGKAARELCYSIAAFARCAGSGRGARRPSSRASAAP